MKPVHSARKEEKVVAERREASEDTQRNKTESGIYQKEQGNRSGDGCDIYIKSRKNRLN